MPPAIFQFLANSISNMAKDFYSYPLEFDDSFISVNVGVKQVQVNNQTRCDYHSNAPVRNTSHKPCSLCSYKGFEEKHYPLSNRCVVKKLSSQEILKIMDATRSCPTCALAHSINYTCVSTWQDGTSKSIPMMKSLETTSALLEIQYDTGFQLSLISKSALHLLPEDSYSLGNSSRINLLDFRRQGQLFNTTEVKINLYNIVLKLVVIDVNLDSVSAYSFPTPPKWMAYTGHNLTSHSGRVSILLGGDNFLNFPKEVERD